MIGGRTPGHGTPGRSPFGFGTPGRRDPEMYNSPFRSPLAGLSFGGFSPMQTSGFSPTRSPGGLGGTGYSPTSPGQLRILSVLMLPGLLLHSLQAVFCSELPWPVVISPARQASTLLLHLVRQILRELSFIHPLFIWLLIFPLYTWSPKDTHHCNPACEPLSKQCPCLTRVQMNLIDIHALVCLQDTRPHLQVSPAELVMSPVSVSAPGLCMRTLIPRKYFV